MKTHLKISIAALILFVNSYNVNAQCTPLVGPGGFGGSTNTELWLDASQLSLSNNDPVSTWTDRSGNGRDATQTSSGNKPTFLTSQLNSLPVIDFDGSNDYITTGAISDLNTADLTWIIVGKADNNTHTGHFISANYNSGAGSASDHLWKTYISSSTNDYMSFTRSSTGTSGSGIINHGYSSGYHIMSNIWVNATDENHGYFDGTLSGTQTGVNASPATNNNVRFGASSTAGPTQFLNGKIAEVIVLTGQPDESRRIIIENYLATKYGLTLSGLDIYSYEGTNQYDPAGIGRTATGIHGKTYKARSNIVEISDQMHDEDFMMWAHDNAPTTSSTSNVPAAYVSTSGSRMQRVWRADKTASYSSTLWETYKFYLSGIIPGTPSNIEMLIDADGDFSSGSTSITTGYSYDNTCSVATWTTTIPDGYYFTIGSPDGTSTFSRMVKNNSTDEDIMNANNFNVYPNPTNGEFNVSSNSLSKNTTIEISNAFGQIILKENITETNSAFNIQNQAKGIYFVKILEQGKISSYKKIIKQ